MFATATPLPGRSLLSSAVASAAALVSVAAFVFVLLSVAVAVAVVSATGGDSGGNIQRQIDLSTSL
jgi:hypothetical protein